MLVWLFFFSLPWTGAVVALGVPSPARVLGLLAICSSLVYVLQAGFKRPHLGEWYVGAFLFLYLVSYFWAESADSWKYRLESVVSVIVAVVVLWQCLGRLLSFSSIAAALAMGSVLLALTVLVARLIGVEYGFGRVSAGTLDPNEVAFMLAFGMAILGGNLLAVPQALRFALQLLVVIAVLQTGSRTGLLAIVMVAISTVVVGGLSVKRALIVLAAVTVAAATIFVAWDYLPAEVTMRTVGTVAEFRGERETDRLNVWHRVIEVIGSSLPLGVGGAGVAPALNTMTGRYVEAHNVLLSLLAQFGVLGAIFLLLLSISFVVRALRIWRIPGMLALCLVITCFMQMLSLEYRAIFWVALLLVFHAGDLVTSKRVQAVGRT